MSEDVPLVSVIIPTTGRAALSACLDTVLHQTLCRSKYEVVVVDDASNASYGWLPEGVNLRRLSSSCGPASARNHGVSVANAPMIAFTDDDCLVPAHWLESLLDGFAAHPEVAAVGGYLRPIDGALARSPVARLEFYEMHRGGSLLDQQRVGRSDTSPAWGTNNIAWRREALQRLGGLQARLRVAEDSDLAQRAGAVDMMTLYLPLPVLHNRPYTWGDMWAQHFARGRQTTLSLGSRNLPRALARLPLAAGRALTRITTGDVGIVATSFLRDLAFTMGRAAVTSAELCRASESAISNPLSSPLPDWSTLAPNDDRLVSPCQR